MQMKKSLLLQGIMVEMLVEVMMYVSCTDSKFLSRWFMDLMVTAIFYI